MPKSGASLPCSDERWVVVAEESLGWKMRPWGQRLGLMVQGLGFRVEFSKYSRSQFPWVV